MKPPRSASRVLIVAGGGQVAHNLLRDSNVLEELIDMGAHIIILAQDEGVLKSLNLPAEIEVDTFSPPRQSLHNKWYSITRYLFQTIIPSSTNEAREERMRHEEPMRFFAVKLVRFLRAPQLLRVWIKVRHLLFPIKVAEQYIEKHRPDVILVGTLGHTQDSYYFLRAAQCKQIPSICNIVSWDKLTVKEYVLERPDKLVVWNEFNRDEAIRFHQFKLSDVYIAGIPHFDFYAEPRMYPDRYAFLAAHGLDSKRKLLLLTLQPLDICQNLDEVMKILAHALQYGKFACDCQVLVRPHPWVYFGRAPGKGTEEDLQYYEALHPLIRGNRPDAASQRAYDKHQVNKAPGLAAALYHADVVLDYYGTVSLEANLLKRPVVYIDNRSFFPDSPSHNCKFNMNYSKFTHLQYPIQSGIGRTVKTEAELISAINDFLLDPNKDRIKRKQAIQRLCFATDGRSSWRLAHAVISLANGQWPPVDHSQLKEA